MELMLIFPFAREYFLAMGLYESDYSFFCYEANLFQTGSIKLNIEISSTTSSVLPEKLKIIISVKKSSNNTPLVPVFSFGEANTADVLDLTVTGPLEHIP
ncbi:hypothetical protein ACFE04_008292 [Oxalis oulophora]